VAKTKTKAMPMRISPLLPIKAKCIVDYQDLCFQERKNLSAIQVLSFAGQYTATAEVLGKALSIEVPTVAGTYAANDHTQVIWTGPNTWMIIASDEESGRKPGELLEIVKKAVGDLAAVVDQSHGRCGLRLSGKHASAVMSKNCALDFNPRVFNPGNCALTSVAHMSALVVQVDDSPSYDLFVARSLARSFAHAIEQACEEFA
jgi:heterotetrameric sarcosine oxidase gamma subunit